MVNYMAVALNCTEGFRYEKRCSKTNTLAEPQLANQILRIASQPPGM